MTRYKDIFAYIEAMEEQYRRPIPINEKWDWSMREHIVTTENYINGRYADGKSQEFRPFKNIIKPILNLAHRTEDIDVTDVAIYVDDPSKYHLSFLVKKYHDDVFVRENDIDTFLDELNVSRIDYGSGLSKKLNKPAPEVVPLQAIAFCDQTDILSGPIGLKHYFSPDQLMDMKSKGWGDTSKGATATIEETIALSREEKKEEKQGRKADTPGRYIEVYEVHGNLPKYFADPANTTEEHETRLWIVCFYQKKDSPERSGIVLYSAPETKSPFKVIKRDPIHGRALGTGGAEEIFEPQVWINYDEIRKQDMKDAAAKTILKAIGPNSTTIAARTNLKDMENLEILDVGQDSDIGQVDTFPRNFQLFENDAQAWEAHAQKTGAANDSIMGESPASGTPFKLQELVTAESHGLHEYRRKQYAKHIEEIYTDWIIPHIQKKVTEGVRFLSELSLEELQYVSDCVVRNEVHNEVMDRILSGNVITKEEVEILKEEKRASFQRKGPKQFIEILKGEFKSAPLAVKVSVAGKSKNLAATTDKITNIIRFVVQAGGPTALSSPGLWNLINQTIEHSGLDPVDFSDLSEAFKKQAAAEAPTQPLLPEQEKKSPIPAGITA